ncbi:zinc-ribbon domain-containing protein [Eubacterium ruminantium]|nr:zinc-ribbon domain-containing protein [Eubacterium ruminantium]
MKCSVCGNEIPDNSTSCPYCGVILNQHTQPTDNSALNTQPAYNPTAYDQPTYDQNQYFQPTDNQNPFAQPAYNQPANMQPMYDQNQYSQPTFGQNQFTQPTYNPAANNQLMYGQGQYSQMSYDQNQYSQPIDNPYFAAPPSMDGGYTDSRKPGKAKKGKNFKIAAIITTCVIILAGLGVGAYFFFFNRGESPVEVTRNYLEALLEGDFDKASKYFLDGTRDYHQKMFTSALNTISEGINIEVSKVHEDGNVKPDVVEELNYTLNELCGITCSAYKYVSCELKSDSFGSPEAEKGRFILGKYKDKWYLICLEDNMIEARTALNVCDKFMKAFTEFDAYGMFDCFPNDFKSDYTNSEMQDDLNELKKMNVVMTASSGTQTDIDGDELDKVNKELLSNHGFTVEDAAYVDYKITFEFIGETADNDYRLIAGKINGNWYVVDYDN